MKKRALSLAAVFVLLTILTAACGFADAGTVSAPIPDSTPAANPALAEEETDPFVGAWRMPPSPFGDDFTAYVVLNADGSFLNATNLYESGNSGKHTQTVVTNETFRWQRTGSNTLELHYSYQDDNGEFVTELSYNAKEDAFYFYGEVYAVRDTAFVLEK